MTEPLSIELNFLEVYQILFELLTRPEKSKTRRREVELLLKRLVFGLVFFFFVEFSCCFASSPASALPPGVTNTQNPADQPLPPQEGLKRIKVPEGFHVSLFAAEPDVMQPIDFDFDDRGRLWVVECFSYLDPTNFSSDRVLIFTDRDNDGRYDQRQVFLERGRRLTSVAWGLGGVWLLSIPELIFIPDADGDGHPDGPPVVHLDGWSMDAIHNFVNGLTWGPDGWLYGRHGMYRVSKVGRPGTPEKDRVPMDCGIWRYHPIRRKFEVVARGAVNPWGLDWNEVGDSFFSNNVNGHLWHVVPGAHYEHAGGDDFAPYIYARMRYCADHLHFGGRNWQEGWIASRGGTGIHGELGGGHSHCGAMIYLGDNWPERYRGTVFMCNTHGRRVNNDRLERSGSGYVGKHNPDFLFSGDPWFRGVKLLYGPDGGVFLSDWQDLGECHDTDGIHKSSGRIYKITYGQASRRSAPNLSLLSDRELVQLQGHKNDWFVRHARRLLQERAARGTLQAETRPALVAMLTEEADITRKLRAMWALHTTGGIEEPLLKSFLSHDSENIRRWAVELGAETQEPPAWFCQRMAAMAATEKSALVRLALASAMQRVPLEDRWFIAEALLGHAEDSSDSNLPLMIWYGLAPAIGEDGARATRLLAHCKIPQVRQFIARRLAEK